MARQKHRLADEQQAILDNLLGDTLEELGYAIQQADHAIELPCCECVPSTTLVSALSYSSNRGPHWPEYWRRKIYRGPAQLMKIGARVLNAWVLKESAVESIFLWNIGF